MLGRVARPGWTAALAALAAISVASAGAPVVSKVEPPNWWAGHSINPVRLLVRGSGFTGASVHASRDWKASAVRISSSGTSLFVDVTIPKGARAGAAPLTMTTPDGSAQIAFEITAPLARAERFQGFGPDDLIYLVMPDRFADGDPSNNDPAVSRGLYDRSKPRYYHGGDLQGIIDHLPYLKSLGVTALWLNPVYDNTNRLNLIQRQNGEPVTDYHGYGAIDFYGVDEHLGSLAKFQELVDAAHRCGIKIIQDQVANHTSPYHPWVADPPTPTWCHGTPQNHLDNPWLTRTLVDPHSTPSMRRATLDGWFGNVLPDLNQDDAEVSRYLIQNSLWWIGSTGIDGIREDTLPYAPRRFWREWSAAIHREYPRFRIAGEVFEGDPSVVSFFQGGRSHWDGIDSGIDALFDFPLYYAVRRAFAERQSMRDLAAVLAHDGQYPNPAMMVTFAGLHDVQRFLNERGADVRGLKLALTFVATTRGIPLIYYGDEVAMEGGNDPDNRRDFPGGFPGDRHSAFTATARTPNAQSVFEHVRKLAMLRTAAPCLRTGLLENLVATGRVYAYARSGGGCSAIIALNNGESEERVESHAPFPAGSFADALGSGGTLRVSGRVMTVALPPRSGMIFIAK